MFKKTYFASQVEEIIICSSSSGRSLAPGPNAPRDISFHIGLQIDDVKPFVASLSNGAFHVRREYQQTDYLSAVQYYVLRVQPKVLVYDYVKPCCEFEDSSYEFLASIKRTSRWLAQQPELQNLRNGSRRIVALKLLAQKGTLDLLFDSSARRQS